eukprot:CAMPEP_0197326648 /NCGR_PEP_ID=MMETSP0892-20130614/1932_1 /TAXON_ID=44058 ORGANISM="Aureoumbra lagunensis, Strain CCMP1510" /NCGR_SAMPLE_ID=MMETSP0892 /ASSEMBLY_ACC=CAM_ASM_000538 /LENGTH=837 /DNA_ID=CAMNT_0042820869 /DNA_START=113 /DNA_END=2626 /DNA_ORIENTATION=+
MLKGEEEENWSFLSLKNELKVSGDNVPYNVQFEMAFENLFGVDLDEVPKEQKNSLYKKLDVDGDGTIDEGEWNDFIEAFRSSKFQGMEQFLELVHIIIRDEIQKANIAEEKKIAADLWTPDELIADGQDVPADKFLQSICSTYNLHQTQPQILQAFLKALDENGDGSIEAIEWFSFKQRQQESPFSTMREYIISIGTIDTATTVENRNHGNDDLQAPSSSSSITSPLPKDEKNSIKNMNTKRSPPPPPPPRKTVHTSEALQHKNENSTPLNSSNRPKSSVLARAAMFEKRSSTTNNNVSSSRSKDAQSEIGQSGSLQDRKSAFENSLSSSTNLSQGRAEINKRTGSLRHLSAKFEASPQSQKSEQMTMARKEIAQLGSLQARIQKLQSSKTHIPLFSNGDMKNTCDDVATTTNSIARQEIAQLHHEQDRNENFEKSRNNIAHLFQNGPARAPRTSKTFDDGSSTCSRGPIHQIGQPISGRGQKARGLGLGRTMPASRNKPQKVKTIKFVVIGSPGHGKSTCLNEIAQEDYFEMSAGGKSCTQAGGVWDKKNRSEIIVCDDEVEYHLTLIDTPGFPDPDASKAAHYYDYLVKKCSEPINGVLFVMKPERIIPDVLKRYKILMQQFVYLCVPMVVLVNGYFTRSRLDDDESFAIRKKNDIKDMRQTATRILAATGLHPREIFISWCLDDIADFGPDIAHAFSIDGAASSNLKTISQIQDEVKRCRDSIYAAEAERNRYNVQIGRIASDIESLYKTLDKYEAVKDSGIGYIPIIGWGISKYSAIKAAEKNARIHELEASKKLLEFQRDSGTDEDALRREQQQQENTLNELLNYLKQPLIE